MRIRVKICGITNLEDALLASELGADALGFIFYQDSPRYIAPDAARAIINALPPFIIPVAVVVNESLPAIKNIMTISGCRAAQIHGDEPEVIMDNLEWPIIRAFAVNSPSDLPIISNYPEARAILLDTKITGQFGGTGTSFDWGIALIARLYGKPIILAGGLSPENVMEAITAAQPWAIDASSRLEKYPGKKDPALLREFFAALQ